MKIGFVLGFAMSCFHSIEMKCPFFCGMHETYELVDSNYKYLSE